MKNYLLLLGFIFTQLTFAQNTKVYPDFYEIFTCKNPNGVTETLLATFNKNGKRGFIYKSSKNPNKEIPLNIIENQNDEYFVVKFPNDTKRYVFTTCIACPELQCTNPDGSKQVFNMNYRLWGNRGTYRCINADKTIEYLYIEGSASDLVVKYSSSKNPKWINLKVSNVKSGDMDNLEYFDVQFPNDKRNYRIEGSGERYEYYVWLPNGGQQNFEWINK